MPCRVGSAVCQRTTPWRLPSLCDVIGNSARTTRPTRYSLTYYRKQHGFVQHFTEADFSTFSLVDLQSGGVSHVFREVQPCVCICTLAPKMT